MAIELGAQTDPDFAFKGIPEIEDTETLRTFTRRRRRPTRWGTWPS